jgi:hypothetical protein
MEHKRQKKWITQGFDIRVKETIMQDETAKEVGG